ncbi:MAG: hypothetical protein NC251_06360 [Lachnoclostridium sp.]|nr:hypothetical protein [Lachnospira sp.]MCM1248037.1 hypothetical protein [Lachnoclostridium sp.]MCM1535854.1 hypothetical protein [Clostridium sp.]
MKKEFLVVVVLMAACLMCGCAGQKKQDDSLKGDETFLVESVLDAAESERKKTGEEDEAEAAKESALAASESSSGADGHGEKSDAAGTEEEGIWFLGPKKNTDFNFSVDQYDYAFYFKGIYLSRNGESDKIYIDPVEFVWNWETERWLAWGNSIDDGPYCEHRNEKEEVISLPLTKDTEFHMCYYNSEPMLSEICDRYQDLWENVTTNPAVFMYYLRVGGCSANYPYFLILNEDGTVKYVIEAPLV